MSEQFELDQGDNLFFLIDLSGSMQKNDTPTGKSRLDYSKEKAIALADNAVKYDPDGVDIIGFGEGARFIGKLTGQNAESVIGPLKAIEGQTDTHEAIQLAYSTHKKNGYQQSFCFLVTDGAPTSMPALKETIINITNDIKDEHEFAIGFLLVGDPARRDPQLVQAMKDLDDNLKDAKYDIVDVKELAEVKDLIQIAAGALHD